MKKVSKNIRAEQICGLRPEGIPIDFPIELGYVCPKNKLHSLEWSEYNNFIWCEQCNFDYPSPLCLRDYKRATDLFLDILDSLKVVLKD